MSKLSQLSPEQRKSHADFIASMREFATAVDVAKIRDRAKYTRLQSRIRTKLRCGLPPEPTPRKDGSRVSPYVGVTYNIRDRLWVARIKVAKQSITLGVYTADSAEKAARLYDVWAWYWFGPTARRNFPDSPKGKTVYVPPESVPNPLLPGETLDDRKACFRCRGVKSVLQFTRMTRRRDGVMTRRVTCRECAKRTKGRGPLSEFAR